MEVNDVEMVSKPARTNAFKLSGGGYKPLKTKHFTGALTLTLTLALTLSLALSFSSVLPAFSQEPADDHAYTLTKIEVQDPSNLPANTITKYEWSETENKLTPVYYRLDLKQTDYGHTTDYDEVKTFTVTTPNADNTGNAFEYEINYYVNNDRLSPDRITTDQNGADIDMDFVNLELVSLYPNGSSIYNDGKIGNITGDFIDNNIFCNTNGPAYGGAIYNEGSIEDITGNFIANYADGPGSAYGGAIYNEGSIGDITGNFIANYVLSDIRLGTAYYFYAIGGAIDNSSKIGNVIANFIGNYAYSNNSLYYYYYAYGGAIYNRGTIGDITGDFIANHVFANSVLASGGNAYANGGAIYNSGGLGLRDNDGNLVGGIINSNFIANYAESTNGEAHGGAIYTTTDLNIIAKDGGHSVFSGNYTKDSQGKIPNAIYVQGPVIEELIITSVDLTSNKVIYDYTSTLASDEPFPTLTLNANTNGTIVFDDQISGSAPVGTLKYSADIALTEAAYEQYGNISSIEEYISKVKENYSWMHDYTDEEIIDRGLSNGEIVKNNDEVISSETSQVTYNLKITGDSTGKVILNNDVINANISLDNTNLYLGRENVFDQSQSLSLNSGNLYLNNNSIGTMHVPTLNLNGNTNLSVDVDLANKQMDRITADNYNITNNDAFINVNNINLLSDSNQQSTSILFADEQLANNVQYSGPSPIAYSPIYKYDVSYSTNPEDNLGYFFFNRSGSSSGNQSDAFNPAVLTPSVATQAGAYTTQLQTFNYAFQHSDSFMNIPSLDRLSIINNNKYALNTTNFSPLLTPHSHNGFWVKPYASFESIPLNNGPTVSNINYGTLIGYDSDIKQINHGFNRVLTAYIGYNGASQRYQGVDAYQNGGILGTTTTFYKGNFFNATTLSVGASVGDATTMYGSENYTMLMAGIGNKFGYNFEFKQGKYILQPNFLMSYSFINTFDYTNAANVRIESDPLHALQLSPGIKFIMNTKNGWQPYLAVNMTWNILDETKVTANDVRLPSMSIDPYVSYGAGIQKCFKDDRFTAYGQAMVHNGGRNGVSLTAGFRWRVGKD